MISERNDNTRHQEFWTRRTLIGIIRVAAQGKAMFHARKQLIAIDFVSFLEDIKGTPPGRHVKGVVNLRTRKKQRSCTQSNGSICQRPRQVLLFTQGQRRIRDLLLMFRKWCSFKKAG